MLLWDVLHHDGGELLEEDMDVLVGEDDSATMLHLVKVLDEATDGLHGVYHPFRVAGDLTLRANSLGGGEVLVEDGLEDRDFIAEVEEVNVTTMAADQVGDGGGDRTVLRDGSVGGWGGEVDAGEEEFGYGLPDGEFRSGLHHEVDVVLTGFLASEAGHPAHFDLSGALRLVHRATAGDQLASLQDAASVVGAEFRLPLLLGEFGLGECR